MQLTDAVLQSKTCRVELSPTLLEQPRTCATCTTCATCATCAICACKHLAEQPRTPQSSLPAASRQSCNVAVWGRQARQAACALLLVDKSEEVQCRRSCQAAAWSLTAPHLARIQSAGGQNLPRQARNLQPDLYLFQFLIKPLAYSV